MNARMLLFFVACAPLACSEAEPLPGQEGGACRVSLEPCDSPLVCTAGGCQAPPEEAEAAVNVQWSFPLMGGREQVEADGVDSLVVQAVLTNRATGELMPQNFGFRMWVDPPEAGTLTILRDFNPLDANARWSLLATEGRAVATFTGCDKTQPGCVRYAAIRLAVEPRPLAAIDQVIIENIGAPVPGGGGAGGAGGDVTGAGGEGGEVPEGPLPPLGPCPQDVARLQIGSQMLEMTIDQTQIRQVSPRILNASFGNEAQVAAVSFLIDGSSLSEDLTPRSYPEVGMDLSIEFRATFENASVCSGFKPDRFTIERLQTEDGTLEAFSAQIGGYCEGERRFLSACLHWATP